MKTIRVPLYPSTLKLAREAQLACVWPVSLTRLINKMVQEPLRKIVRDCPNRKHQTSKPRKNQ